MFKVISTLYASGKVHSLNKQASHRFLYFQKISESLSSSSSFQKKLFPFKEQKKWGWKRNSFLPHFLLTPLPTKPGLFSPFWGEQNKEREKERDEQAKLGLEISPQFSFKAPSSSGSFLFSLPFHVLLKNVSFFSLHPRLHIFLNTRIFNAANFFVPANQPGSGEQIQVPHVTDNDWDKYVYSH